MRMSFKASMPDPPHSNYTDCRGGDIGIGISESARIISFSADCRFPAVTSMRVGGFLEKPSVLCSYAADTVCAARDIHSDCFGFVSAFPFVDGEAISGVFGSEGSD